MATKKSITTILERLDEHYGKEFMCYLNYTPGRDYELLFATIMSAQCTDDRVNMVTKELFAKYTSLKDYLEVPLSELEDDIHSTGFYHNKAKSIQNSARILLEKYNGELPRTIDEMTELPGVGRKTANVALGHLYDIPGIIVDTHVKRISGKLGITKETDPVKIEKDLEKKLPKEHWLRYNTQIIAHGRTICKARNPKCGECFLLSECPWGKAKI
ncbi:endonuclease III [Clostridiales bacterium COT073_COT-073]|nr:endonuclease III [Clostridiales bacterium COT073_COT-073]